MWNGKIILWRQGKSRLKQVKGAAFKPQIDNYHQTVWEKVTKYQKQKDHMTKINHKKKVSEIERKINFVCHSISTK